MSGTRLLILILPFFVVGCSKTTPTFELTDEGAIPMPKFSGVTTKNITVSDATVTISVSGECDHKISSIKGMAVGIATAFSAVSDITASTPTVNCSSNGTFTLVFKSLTDLGFSGFYD